MAKGPCHQPPGRGGNAAAHRSSVKAGELFATFHTAEAALNRLTSPGRDKQTMTPEYKVVAVRVEKMEGENAHG